MRLAMWYRIGMMVLLTFLCVLGWASVCLAEDAGGGSQISAGDTAWVLTSSALVLAMTAPGLASLDA